MSRDDTDREGDDTTLHITHELLQAVRAGRIPPRAVVVIGLEHLRCVCPHCRAEIDRDVEQRRQVAYAGPEGFDETFRSLEAMLQEHSAEMEAQGQRAEGLFAQILAVAPAQRLEHVRASLGIYTEGLVARHLIDAARQATPGEPETVRILAQCAHEICEQLEQRVPDRGGMMVEAVSLLGNAERLEAKFENARALFRLAQATLSEEGVTDPMVYAELDSFRGSLARDVGQLKEAARLVSRAAVVYSGLAEVVLAAKCAVKLGYIHYQAGEYQESLRAFQRALRHLRGEEEPRLLLCARHTATLCLFELGELVVAGQRFEEDQPLYARFDDAWTRLRRDWLEGRLLAAVRPDEGARVLRLVQRAFLVEHAVYDAVLVSLDLAQVLLQGGRVAELDGLAAELSEVLRVEGATMAAETVAITRTVLATIMSGSATVRLIADTAALLRRQGRPPAAVGSAN